MNRRDDWQERFPELVDDEGGASGILEEARVIEIPPGQVVFRAGALCENYLLVLSGSVRVQVLGEAGREALLYRVMPGQSCILTTCCMISNECYPAEGFSEGQVRALALSKTRFDEALDASPAFRRFVFANLGARIAEVISRMEEVTFRPVERRLAAYLVAPERGRDAIRATHQTIAVEVCTAREVVSRHLKRLESKGLVRLGRSAIEVLDPEGLRRLAGEHPPVT